MMNLEYSRHTLAHLLAAAVLKKYPHAKLTLGPAVDTGFYYDIDFAGGAVPKDANLPGIEAMMRNLLPQWKEFSHKEVSHDEARAFFAGNPYKLELIDEIAARGEAITLYTCGNFTDLCRGGHVDHPSTDIPADSFSLEKIAGAYWRGSEKNAMLTRIYGLAFESKEALDAHTTMIEEAKKRDHRKLGKELGLFTFSELVGAGLPLWLPKGAHIRELLNDYIWSIRKKHGYQKVAIPHITKSDLYKTSGHWQKYAEDLFKINTREGREYAMKPMNCPHHTQIFDAEPKSYRDMPQRYAETTMVYRDEQSGEVSGLTRVLAITQDDAHVFCRENQITAEIESVWDIITTFYSTFGFSLTPRFSRRDMSQPEKYMGEAVTWDKAEGAIANVLSAHTKDWIDGPGEAAFYGPKIDFMAKDAIGRTHQVATIQLDFIQPTNFGLTCVNEKGEKEPVVMIHCAVMGSIERFLATYIEHTAGNFPLWLAPEQVRIVPVADTHVAYAQDVRTILAANDISVIVDDANESLGKKIRSAKMSKLPYIIVIGDKEVEAHNITLEARDGSKSVLTVDELVAKLITEIATRAK